MSLSSVIIRTWPDPGAAFLGTGFMRFQSRQGIDGLLRINGYDLELLAVFASQPGTGQFRRFIEAAKRKFDTIAIYEIWNDGLPAVLTRYGFAPVEKEQDDGEVLTGFIWKRPE